MAGEERIDGETEGRKPGDRARLAQRALFFCLGLLVNSFGIALITRSGLGTSQISSLPYVWSLADPRLGFALTTFIVNMAFIVAQAIMLGRSFFPVQLLQIVANVVFSSFLGLAMGALVWFQPASLPLQVVSLLAGCLILGTGVAIECAPGLIYVPGEGIVHALSEVTGMRLGTAKLAVDASLVAAATILSFALFGRLEGVGVGTIATAFMTGGIVNLANAHLPLVGRIRAISEA
jgi:uncharacterized membrane protein YczE